MKTRPKLALLGLVALVVAGLSGALRPSPELDVPGFTQGRRTTSVYDDRGFPGRPGTGWRKHTMYSLDGPWRASVDRFGALVQARGFVRAKGPGMPVWTRGDETVSMSGHGTGRSLRTTRASLVSLSRPATLGDVVWGYVRREVR